MFLKEKFIFKNQVWKNFHVLKGLFALYVVVLETHTTSGHTNIGKEEGGLTLENVISISHSR